jgi:hypothetical protein
MTPGWRLGRTATDPSADVSILRLATPYYM